MRPSRNYDVPVAFESGTVLTPHPLFGLQAGKKIHYVKKHRYGRGEVVIVKTLSTGQELICANFSVQDGKYPTLLFIQPVWDEQRETETFKLLTDENADLEILGSVVECTKVVLGPFKGLRFS
jgi:hypothetical protein